MHRDLGQEVIPKSQEAKSYRSVMVPTQSLLDSQTEEKAPERPKPAVAVSVFGDNLGNFRSYGGLLLNHLGPGMLCVCRLLAAHPTGCKFKLSKQMQQGHMKKSLITK